MKLINTLLFLFLFACVSIAQPNDSTELALNSKLLNGMKWRNIGPAFTSGRIADIAIHPDNNNVWYVAVGSGGVWKTENGAITWKPIFDDQSSYSTGCVTIDPNNPHTIWVGTGENVGGRHVGFGDGIYRSDDDGASWKNMGLKESQHISKIIVHPGNSDVIYVAAQGPLWSKGGERGFYKSIDGGKTWKKTLGDEEWTGVTDIAMDPRDPNLMYAATWQRHRTIAALLGGGPESGVHRSTDGGETWTKIKSGLPSGNMGKIGLAISPQQPDIVYAAIELDRKKGGLYRSDNRGASWKKMSDAVSGATGPHYYQELYADPNVFDKLYLMDVRIQVSEDGGKTFKTMDERGKHSDNHAIAFRKGDPNYLLIGTDAGIYETMDGTTNWKFIDNLPITQYYKLAVDDAEPFYHIFAGTQDNGSHGGPSRTDNEHGIRNTDWYKTLGADGHQAATEPGNPNIIYGEFQEGTLFRIDRITGESVYIAPQPAAGEPYERFNWDAPIVVSPHKPTRLYFASQRVWRSEDRGDSWTAISGDLTKNQERIAQPIMGRVQGWDNAWDVTAMSNYNTISSLAESPKMEGLIYAGTDDGAIQVTEDGGANWRKIDVGTLPEVPATAFVNNIYADQHDASTVYVALDNHKYGDFKPYLVKSADKGKTWKSITNGLGDRTLVWRIVQDHIKPSLMFLATEFGIYTTLDGGMNWIQMKSGLPTIAFRDITIQKRENDVVGASFGRGFYILDDYSPMRELSTEALKKEGHIYSIKTAALFEPKSIAHQYGQGEYEAENPPFGAVISYHINGDYPTIKSLREKKEKELNKSKSNVPFPGWDALEKELTEEAVSMFIQITDAAGNIVNEIDAKSSKGFNRVAWNLRSASKNAISFASNRGGGNRWNRSGAMVSPGTYNATLYKKQNGEITKLSETVSFEVAPLYQPALTGKSPAEKAAYQASLNEIRNAQSALNYSYDLTSKQLAAMKEALEKSDMPAFALHKKVFEAEKMLKDFELLINGYETKNEIGEKNNPTFSDRVSIASRGTGTYGPTATHLESLAIARAEYNKLKPMIEKLANVVIPEIESALIKLGIPYIQGQALPEIKN